MRIPIVAPWAGPEDESAAAAVAADVVVATGVLAIVVADVDNEEEAVDCDDLVEELDVVVVLDVMGIVVSTVPAANLIMSLVLSQVHPVYP